MNDTREARIREAKERMISCAHDYVTDPDPDTWKELCRAKATLDALRK